MAQAVSSARPEARTANPERNEPRGIRLNLHEGWIAGVLLALMLVSVTASLAAANWVDGLWQTMWAALAGMLFSALVARLRLNGVVALALALIVGAAFVEWLVSFHVGAPPGATWNEKVLFIQDRLDVWMVRVLGGGIGTDNFAFLCVMCAMSWLIGYVGGWSVFRHHQPWGAILPAGAALLINLFYAPPQSGVYLVLFLLAALLLLVRTTLLKRQETWSAYAIRFANDIGLDFLVYGVIFSGLIILIAWLIPPTAPGPLWFGFVLDQVREPWQDFQDDMSRAFSSVRGTNNAAPTTYFGTSLAMGGPVRLGGRDVFQIDSPTGDYWRAVVFDRYTGTGWVSHANESADLVAGDPRLKTQPTEKRRVITSTVEVRLPTDDLVVSASQPQQVNQAVAVKYLVGHTANGDSYLDVHSLRLQNPVKLGDVYIVASSVSTADTASLRAASPEIPDYIRSEYLNLPPTVTDRTRDLAFRITAGKTTNYDKAQAIEAYLREHITYNASVEPMPAGWDGVDYLLFERPEGYCNYYASAMAVLARIVGIPSRVASGYAEGEVADDGYYHINESNAHSWPELYFGDLGWIEFEPTAARPEIVRPVPQSATDPSSRLRDLNDDDEDLANRRLDAEMDRRPMPPIARGFSIPALEGWMGALTIGLVLAGILVAGTLTLVQWRWDRHLKTLKPGAAAAEEMYRFARYAGLKDRAETTADERAEQLASLVPETRDAIQDVNALYVGERYGAVEVSQDAADAARKSGVAVQKQMWKPIYARHIGARLDAVQAWWQANLRRVRELRDSSKPKE